MFVILWSSLIHFTFETFTLGKTMFQPILRSVRVIFIIYKEGQCENYLLMNNYHNV